MKKIDGLAQNKFKFEVSTEYIVNMYVNDADGINYCEENDDCDHPENELGSTESHVFETYDEARAYVIERLEKDLKTDHDGLLKVDISREDMSEAYEIDSNHFVLVGPTSYAYYYVITENPVICSYPAL